MTTQPHLPDPVAFSIIEQAYIEDSPRGLWPDNQDSNFGIHRKFFCDQLLSAVTQLQTIFNEMFPDTSVTYITEWEEQLGLTVNPPGRTLTQRQSAVIARSRRGAFTRTGRANTIEGFITATYGSAAAFGTTGIVIGAGVILHSGVGGDPKQFYQIVEDISNFKYHVWIDNRIAVDLTSLNQELLRMTPAGISFDISTLYQKQNGGVSAGKGGGVLGQLLSNGTFEAGVSGWASYDGTSTFAQDVLHPNPAGSGTKTLKVIPAATISTGVRSAGNALIATGKYNISAFCWAPIGQLYKLVVYRADFTTVIATATFTGTGAIQPINLAFTAPATETEYLAFLSNQASAQPFWVDDVTLWRSS